MKCSYAVLLLMFIAYSCKSGKENSAAGADSTGDLSWVQQNFEEAAKQYHVMMEQLPEHRFPTTFEDGGLKTSGSDWWCSGFYPGTLLYIYEETGDQELLDEAKRVLGNLEKEKWNKTTHDLDLNTKPTQEPTEVLSSNIV